VPDVAAAYAVGTFVAVVELDVV
jgi:hypothetical protein